MAGDTTGKLFVWVQLYLREVREYGRRPRTESRQHVPFWQMGGKRQGSQSGKGRRNPRKQLGGEFLMKGWGNWVMVSNSAGKWEWVGKGLEKKAIQR